MLSTLVEIFWLATEDAEDADDEAEEMGLVKEEAWAVALVVGQHFPAHISVCFRFLPLRDILERPLGLVLIATKTLSDPSQLGLDVLNVQHADLGPNGGVEEEIGLIPCPVGSGDGGLGGELGRYFITLGSVRLDELVGGKENVVVGLQGVGARNVVVRPYGSGRLGDMRSDGLVVLILGLLLVDSQLGLDVLVPLGLSVGLGLQDAGSTMLGDVGLGRDEGALVCDVVVGSRLLDIGSGVGLVVGLEVGRYGVFQLEVRLANLGGGLVAGVESRGAAEED